VLNAYFEWVAVDDEGNPTGQDGPPTANPSPSRDVTGVTASQPNDNKGLSCDGGPNTPSQEITNNINACDGVTGLTGLEGAVERDVAAEAAPDDGTAPNTGTAPNFTDVLDRPFDWSPFDADRRSRR
jgi:hypothetical protein